MVETKTKVERGKNSEGKSFINQYVIDRTLGEGSFGKVKLAYAHGQSFAVKIFKKGVLRRRREYIKSPDGKMIVKDALQGVMNEIDIMKNLKHPNIVNLYETLDDEVNDKLYIVIAYAEGGPVLDWDEDQQIFFHAKDRNVTQFTEAQTKKWFVDIANGLKYLHDNKIIHRDIKPQNILVDEQGMALIADFGQASRFEESDLQTRTEGTYHFQSPECSNPKTKQYSGKAADVWALGISLYALIYRTVPFTSSNIPDLLKMIETQEVTYPAEPQISSELKDLFSKILEKDPNIRLNVDEVLAHAWTAS